MVVNSLVCTIAALLIAAPVQAFTPEQLYTVEVDGKLVNVVELKEVKHCGTKHHWWQLVTMRGLKPALATVEDYHVYRTLEDYDTVLSPKQYKAVAKQLRDVPDNRDYKLRYPFKSEAQSDINTALGVAVTAAQFAK